MSADQYLRGILDRERVDTGPFSPVRGVVQTLSPMLNRWAGQYLLSINPSGSFAKGTANRSGTDIDLFLSLSSNTPDTLSEIRSTLRTQVTGSGYAVRDQNVSLGINVGSYKVDLVPAKRQGGLCDEIRILKLWRDQEGLDFPSIFLELAIIRALHGRRIGDLSNNVWSAFVFLRNNIASMAVIDPANSANHISADVSVAEKQKIANAARSALAASNWSQIVV